MSLEEREAWEESVLSDKEASEQKVPAGEGLEGSFEWTLKVVWEVGKRQDWMSEDLEIPDCALSPPLCPLPNSSSRSANEGSLVRQIHHPVFSISNFPAPIPEAPAPPHWAGKV